MVKATEASKDTTPIDGSLVVVQQRTLKIFVVDRDIESIEDLPFPCGEANCWRVSLAEFHVEIGSNKFVMPVCDEHKRIISNTIG